MSQTPPVPPGGQPGPVPHGAGAPVPGRGPQPWSPGPYQQPGPIAPGGKPVRPEEYQQLLRNGARAWWRPLLSLLVTVVTFLVLVMVLYTAVAVWGAATGVPDLDTAMSTTSSPLGFAVGNLLLAAFIPAVVVGVLVGHQVRPTVTFSVAGRFRWGWALRVTAALLPLWALFVMAMWALDGFSTSPPPRAWVALVVLCLVTTPLQSAGEEFLFRVWFLQSLGSLIPHRWLALAVPTAVSVPLFALAHGSLDLFVLADIGLFAVAACLVTWRTGGIEAAVVMHAVNNVSWMLFGLLAGGFDDLFVDEASTGNVVQVIVSAVQLSLATGIIFLLARRADPQRTGHPELFRRDRAARQARFVARQQAAATGQSNRPAGWLDGV